MAIVISGTTGISANAAQFLIGQVIFMAGANAPSGFLKCNGQLVSRTTYASLFAVIGTTYGAGDGSTTFQLPDLRGEFLRGFDDGRGVDSGRGIGTEQGDAIRNITGQIGAATYQVTGVGSGAFSRLTNSTNNNNDAFVGTANSGFDFDASRVVPTAPENRPRNVALLACIFTGV